MTDRPKWTQVLIAIATSLAAVFAAVSLWNTIINQRRFIEFQIEALQPRLLVRGPEFDLGTPLVPEMPPWTTKETQSEFYDRVLAVVRDGSGLPSKLVDVHLKLTHLFHLKVTHPILT